MSEKFENEMNLEFLSKSSNEAFARIAVAAFASQLDPSIEELADIKTAVSEAVTNSIIHGYENKTGMVKIIGKLIDNKIILEISDSGKGIENIDVAKEPLYTTKPNLDKVEVESILDIGTKVTMEKKIKKEDLLKEESKCTSQDELIHATNE